MSKRFLIIASVIILIAAVVGGTIGSSRRARRNIPANTLVDEIEKDYDEAIHTISDAYAGDVDYEKASHAAIQGMLSTLGRHSMYFPYRELKKLQGGPGSRFCGIGVTVGQHRAGVCV